MTTKLKIGDNCFFSLGANTLLKTRSFNCYGNTILLGTVRTIVVHSCGVIDGDGTIYHSFSRTGNSSRSTITPSVMQINIDLDDGDIWGRLGGCCKQVVQAGIICHGDGKIVAISTSGTTPFICVDQNDFDVILPIKIPNNVGNAEGMFFTPQFGWTLFTYSGLNHSVSHSFDLFNWSQPTLINTSAFLRTFESYPIFHSGVTYYKNGVFVCNNEPGASGNTTRGFVSFDGGKTWQVGQTLCGANSNGAIGFLNNTFFMISFDDSPTIRVISIQTQDFTSTQRFYCTIDGSNDNFQNANEIGPIATDGYRAIWSARKLTSSIFESDFRLSSDGINWFRRNLKGSLVPMSRVMNAVMNTVDGVSIF